MKNIEEIKNQTYALIDDLKKTTTENGLAGSGNEYVVIVEIFLYKFLNDKFIYEAKKENPGLANAEDFFAAIDAMSEDDYEEMCDSMLDTIILKKEHLIPFLAKRQNEDKFAELFDSTLESIASENSDIFYILNEDETRVSITVVKIGNATVENESNGKNPEIKDYVFIVCDHNKGLKPHFIKLNDGATWGNTKAAANTGVKTTGSDCASAYAPEDEGEAEKPSDEKEYSLGRYTYAFEDLWPNFGDYDMNDIVLITEASLHVKNNFVTKTVLKCRLAAIGATRRIAAAVQLDRVAPNTINRIEYSTRTNFTENLFQTNTNGTEQGQSLAVVPLFDNAHAFAGFNGTPIVGTYRDTPFDAKEFTVTIYLEEQSVEEAKLTLDNWNFFITCNAQQGKRMEIHLINGKATDLFDTSLVGGVVFSPGTPFRAKGNFCWAMQIPGEFRFPLENNNIRQSFENFDSWITKPEYDWYNHFIPEKVK